MNKLHIYKIEVQYGNYVSDFLLTTKEEYPEEFLNDFCKELLETVKKDQIKQLNKLFNKEVPEEFPYQECTWTYVDHMEIKRMDYRIITINEVPNDGRQLQTL